MRPCLSCGTAGKTHLCKFCRSEFRCLALQYKKLILKVFKCSCSLLRVHLTHQWRLATVNFSFSTKRFTALFWYVKTDLIKENVSLVDLLTWLSFWFYSWKTCCFNFKFYEFSNIFNFFWWITTSTKVPD